MINIEQLTSKQQESIEANLDKRQRIVATSGPAGSGKTTIMRFVCERLPMYGSNPVICAPTGKAARRVREATGYKAVTIHMLLEYSKPGDLDDKGKPTFESFPRRSRMKRLDHDVVLCDEYMMVGQELNRNLIDALPNGGRLLTFGDIHQLSPIENNALSQEKPPPFRDLLQRFKGIELDAVHRQAEGSGILDNCQRILRGVSPQRREDFNLHYTDRPVDTLRGLLGTADYRSLDNQIITPSNKSWVGTLKLNDMLQAELLPPHAEFFALPRHKWDHHPVSIAVGDKVVMNKNHYGIPCSDGTLGVFNGEVGRVIELTRDDEVVVDLDDRVAVIPPAMENKVGYKVFVSYPQKDLALAYALTTHKCQGSEYQHVTYIINRSVPMMLNRRNFYTGVSRARKHVNLIADLKGLSLSLSVKEQRSW